MKDDMFENASDPFDRLEDLELVQMGQGLALEEVSQHTKSNSELGIKISQYMLEMVKTIDVLSSKVRELEYRLEQLENK